MDMGLGIGLGMVSHMHHAASSVCVHCGILDVTHAPWCLPCLCALRHSWCMRLCISRPEHEHENEHEHEHDREHIYMRLHEHAHEEEDA
jgi:hypothetical protein